MPMQPIINTKIKFYDYFPHIPVLRMKTEFNLGYYEQNIIRDEIQKAIRRAYDSLVEIHDLRHLNVYDEIGEEFDENFYNELREAVHHHLHDMENWKFLDPLMPIKELENEDDNLDFQTKMTATMGIVLPRTLSTNRIKLKNALVALLNYDIDPLSGRELAHLSKIQ